MQFDPINPMIFDTDAMPGRGSGYWHVNPYSSSNVSESTPSSGKRTAVIFLIALTGILAGGAHMLFT